MRYLFLAVLIVLLVISGSMLQESQPPPILDITGVNATDLPTATVTLNVTDVLNNPIAGLTAEDFILSGELAEVATIVRVENVTDANLTFGVVLVIDTSSSMAGKPFDEARQAAREFINAIGDNDPVAIVAFDSNVRLVQDYTSDKNVLLNAIDSLTYGGQTALYEAAVFGIQKAAQSPTPRRALILLSDGAEYGISRVTRAAALEEAFKNGVSVYTIGLGYGTDRTYLQELSVGTNTTAYESPTAEQLVEIYGGLAQLLRSQYVVTMDVDVPLNGTEYEFGLQAVTPKGNSTLDVAVLRAPIPVPLVSISGSDQPTLTTPVDFTATVAADQELDGISATLNGSVTEFLTEPYTLTIDPFLLAPGDYTLTFDAVDVDGDAGSASTNFSVAALPAVVTLTPDLSTLGELSQPVTVTLDVREQTPTTGVTFTVDGEVIAEDSEAPYEVTLDPFQLSPGEHTLTITTTSESGVVGELAQTFAVAGLPPLVQVEGLNPNLEISEPTTFTINATGQTPIQNVIVTVNDEEVPNDGDFTIDPMDYPPGGITVNITVTDENGQVTTINSPLRIEPVPPVITISGLEEGDVLEEARTVDIDVVSQTPLTAVIVTANGEEVARLTEAPYTFTLEPLDFSPEGYALDITAQDASNQQTTQSLGLEFALSPFLTATPPTATPTELPTETIAPSPTVDTAATSAAGTLVAQSTVDAQATLFAQQTQEAQAAQNAQATADSEATANAQLTEEAQATLDGQATNDAQATVDAGSSATQAAATREQRAAIQASTRDARATQAAQPTATEVAPTSTDVPPTETEAAPTETLTEAAPTETATDVSPTEVEPTETATDAPPTETPAAPTNVSTEEGTQVAAQATIVDATSTPIGELTEIDAQSAPQDDNMLALLAIVCGGGLLLIVLVIIFMARRRR